MSRFFLNRLLDVLRSMEDRCQVPLTLEAKIDINWFTQFLPKFNDIIFFDHRPINAAIELDGSLQTSGGPSVLPCYPLGFHEFAYCTFREA